MWSLNPSTERLPTDWLGKTLQLDLLRPRRHLHVVLYGRREVQKYQAVSGREASAGDHVMQMTTYRGFIWTSRDAQEGGSGH